MESGDWGSIPHMGTYLLVSSHRNDEIEIEIEIKQPYLLRVTILCLTYHLTILDPPSMLTAPSLRTIDSSSRRRIVGCDGFGVRVEG